MTDRINLTGSRSSTKTVFALDVTTTGIAVGLLVVATRPTLQRLKERRLSVPDKNHGTPLRTSPGTYLFLYPDVLETVDGGIEYSGDLQLDGRRPVRSNRYSYSIAVLSYIVSLAQILFTTLIVGGIWIYSNHITSNNTGITRPSTKSKIWNTFIKLAILGTGFAAWGLGMSARSHTTSWSEAVHNHEATKVLYIVYRCVVIASSLSVFVEVLRRYRNVCTDDSGSRSPERSHLARFAMVVVPLIWSRNAFIVYDIVLIFLNTTVWSTKSRLASLFLLIVFGQFANITILGMILYGAWQTGRTVNIFTRKA